MSVQYSTSLNVCFCTTWGQQNQRNMSWNKQKYVTNHPQHFRMWLEEGLADFNNFWCKHFQHYFASNDCSSSHVTKCLLLHYLKNANIQNRIKMQYFVGFVSPGTAKADNGCDKKLNRYLIARCVRNIDVKNYYNLIILLQVAIDNVLFRTQCSFKQAKMARTVRLAMCHDAYIILNFNWKHTFTLSFVYWLSKFTSRHAFCVHRQYALFCIFHVYRNVARNPHCVTVRGHKRRLVMQGAAKRCRWRVRDKDFSAGRLESGRSTSLTGILDKQHDHLPRGLHLHFCRKSAHHRDQPTAVRLHVSNTVTYSVFQKNGYAVLFLG